MKDNILFITQKDIDIYLVQYSIDDNNNKITHIEALANKDWLYTIQDEFFLIIQNNIWILVLLPLKKTHNKFKMDFQNKTWYQ